MELFLLWICGYFRWWSGRMC